MIDGIITAIVLSTAVAVIGLASIRIIKEKL